MCAGGAGRSIVLRRRRSKRPAARSSGHAHHVAGHPSSREMRLSCQPPPSRERALPWVSLAQYPGRASVAPQRQPARLEEEEEEEEFFNHYKNDLGACSKKGALPSLSP